MLLAHDDNCILGAQQNKQMTGLIYDSIIAAYLMTQDGTIIEPDLFEYCIMRITNLETLTTYKKRLFINKVRSNSGKALFSVLFPEDFYYYKKTEISKNKYN